VYFSKTLPSVIAAHPWQDIPQILSVNQHLFTAGFITGKKAAL
jgi:hypothetical protein